MSCSEPQQPAQPPAPDPALKLLDRFLGTWEVHGRTVGAEADDVDGRRSQDGSTFSGGWRPMTGREGPGNIAYDVSGHRAEARE